MVKQIVPTAGSKRIDPELIDGFAARVRGAILQPGDPDYDDARRVRNGLIDRYPALILRCSGTADVVEAVNFARDHQLLLSVRGGAHNVAGNAVNDGGLVIDLSAMRAVHVDPVAKTARVQGGATWGDLDRESQLFGLAAPGGVVSTTGVGGLTLHGGLGHLRRKHGLSIDAMMSADVVTADGQIRHASATENADLFWAIRGAGSNFGVVVSFEFQLYPVGPMVSLTAPIYALADAPTVLRAWREFTANAPDEVNSIALLWSIPDVEMFPPELRKQPVVVVAAVYAGPADEGAQFCQPLRELGTPLLDLSGQEPYAMLQGSFDPFYPEGRFYYWKSTYVDHLTDDAIDTMIERATLRPSHMTSITFWHLGGAIARKGASETAFGRRSAPYLFTAESSWEDAEANERNIAWSRESLTAMQPFSDGGIYLNFPGFGEEKEAMLRSAYGDNYNRLVELKTKFDPGNLFRVNLNIKPRA
jgi:FAD/FMN-containing dehydrogenase